MTKLNKKQNAYGEWEENWKRQLKLWFSTSGEELQLCLVSQGYEDILLKKLFCLFASGFTALKIIQSIKEELNETN